MHDSEVKTLPWGWITTVLVLGYVIGALATVAIIAFRYTGGCP